MTEQSGHVSFAEQSVEIQCSRSTPEDSKLLRLPSSQPEVQRSSSVPEDSKARV